MIGSTADEVVAELKQYFQTEDVSVTIDAEGRILVTVDQKFVCITF